MMKCEKCGAEMKEYYEGHSRGYICNSCGWGIATSYFEPYETDMTQYSIIIQNNKQTISTIKAVSEIADVNYLQAKKLLEMQKAEIFKGKAKEIIKKRDILIKNKILFSIVPAFPY